MRQRESKAVIIVIEAVDRLSFEGMYVPLAHERIVPGGLVEHTY